MKFSGWRFFTLVSLVSVVGLFFAQRAPRAPHAQSPAALAKIHKVIIYPSGNEKIGELKDMGISDVENYGSYWVASVTDSQVDSLKKVHGDRVIEAKYLNRINLGTTIFDTTAGEPSIPSQLRQNDTEDKRLRLIQFKGPVKPQWLEQVKGVGNVTIISYVPNNTYVVWVDAQSEQMLQSLLDPMGPVQWIGPFHPSYKIQTGLLNATDGNGGQMVRVRVGMVDDTESGRTADMLRSFGVVKASHGFPGQKVFGGRVTRSEVSQIAQRPEVLWIEKVEPKRLMDEVQDLIVTSQTNAPGHGPTNTLGGTSALFTNYLDFLLNTVGGGLASFTNQFKYPIVDVADTGLDVSFVVQPSFREFGVGASRVAYIRPGQDGYIADPVTECESLNDNFIGTEDFYNHGTRVASVIAGYDTQTNSLGVLCPFISTNDYTSAPAVSAGPGVPTPFTFGPNPDVPPPFPGLISATVVGSCANIGIIVTTPLGDFVTVTTNLPTDTVTQSNDDIRRDPSGFRFGLGVSPFGRIGSSRIWAQVAGTIGTPPRVSFGAGLEPCLEDDQLPVLFFSAYSLGGRIQNNSWGENITVTGAGGGQYTANSQTYDIAVRDALLVGSGTNVPGPFALNQEFIVVFAANHVLIDFGASGNVGGFGDIRVTAPATAKNVITVGSSENVRLDGSGCELSVDQDDSFDIWQRSAFGPTLDGRFKPEIVAPGTTIYAAKSLLAAFVHPDDGISPIINSDPCDHLGAGNSTLLGTGFFCDPVQPFSFDFVPGTGGGVTYAAGGGSLYDCESGSSYAAPAVSGAIQLLWWYFQNRLTNEVGTALFQPSPAMAKAYLCNSARYLPITNPQTGAMDTLPSSAQGMGELDLLRMFDGVTRVLRDESSPRAIDIPLVTTNPAPQQTYFSQSGQSYEVSGQVANDGLPGGRPFRVTLAWLDPPGTPIVGGGLVNDLDLEVKIGGKTFKGNTFSEDHSVVGGARDEINNLESVFVSATDPAVISGAPYTITVRATSIAGDGVPNVGEVLDQDFALVVYNSQTNFATLSDVPNLTTNDACATAIDITQIPFLFTNTLSKTVYHNEHPSPSAARGGAEEFFKIDRPTIGTTFTIDTFGSAFDTVLSVWSVRVVPQSIFVRGPCGALAELISNNDAGSDTQSRLTFTADGSNTYFIVVEPQNDGAGGTMVLNVGVTNAPVTVTPAQLLFAGQIQGTTSPVQTVIFQNSSTVPVQVTDVSISGSNASDFVIASQTCEGNFIAPGTNCLIRVAFAPQTNGARQANLVITDEATGSPRIVPLSGTGLPTAPLVCLSSGALTFTNQAVGTSSAAQTIVLTNCGTAALTVSNVFFTGSGSNDFAVVQSCTNSVLAPGGICSNSVTFTPLAAGLRQATLTIQTSAGALTTAPVQGTGFVPGPEVCLSPSSLTFGGVGVGATSAVPLSVTVSNCGTALLSVTGAGIDGANPGEFQITANSCGSVATGGTCSISVNFTPTTGGARTAALAISNNASGNPHHVTLTGGGSVSQPDAAIGKTPKVKKLVGNGVISSTGVGEEFVQKLKRGAKRGRRFFITLKNIGTSADQFKVLGDGDSAGFTVKYFLGTTDTIDITAAVEAGTFASSTLAPAATTSDTTTIRVEVFADKAVPKGTVKSFAITFTSASDPTKVDVVKATVIAK